MPLKRLKRNSKTAAAFQDLRTIASTRNDPDLIRSQIFALLEREGLPDGVIEFLDITGILDRVISTAEGYRSGDSSS